MPARSRIGDARSKDDAERGGERCYTHGLDQSAPSGGDASEGSVKMNATSEVRGFNPEDWPWIAALGNANQTETGPLDEAKLAAMSREACLTLAINDDAFLIAFDQDSAYDSPNFLWLRERYGNFVYVDRIVVAERARKLGYGRALYEHVISEARE